MTIQKRQLILELFNHNMIKFGEFTLKSGKKSYIYIDVRTAISYPHIFKSICECYSELLALLTSKYDFICGVPYSALTIASAIAYEHNIPMVLKRKEAKDYGTKKIVEGDYTPGQSCVILEDIITTGASILETTSVLEQHQLKITDIIALIERNQGGVQHLQSHGYKVHYILDLNQVIDVLYSENLINGDDKQRALELL